MNTLTVNLLFSMSLTGSMTGQPSRSIAPAVIVSDTETLTIDERWLGKRPNTHKAGSCSVYQCTSCVRSFRMLAGPAAAIRHRSRRKSWNAQ